MAIPTSLGQLGNAFASMPTAPTVPPPMAPAPTAVPAPLPTRNLNILGAGKAVPASGKATLFNPSTGERKAVGINSEDARSLYAKGFKLETPTQNASTYSATAPKQIMQGPGQDLYASDNGVNTKIANPAALSDLVNKQGFQDTRAPLNFGDQSGGTGGTPPPTPTGGADGANGANGINGTNGTNGTTGQGSDFNSAIAALMKGAQGGGDQDLYDAKRDAITARFSGINSATPEALRGLSPTQQNQIRNGSVEGYVDVLANIQSALSARQNTRTEDRALLKDAVSAMDAAQKSAAGDAKAAEQAKVDNYKAFQGMYAANPAALGDLFRSWTPEGQKANDVRMGVPEGTTAALAGHESLAQTKSDQAQQKIDNSSTKPIAANKYHGNLIYDAKTKMFIQAPGGSSGSTGSKSGSAPSGSVTITGDQANHALDMWSAANNHKLVPINPIQRAGIVRQYMEAQPHPAAGFVGPVQEVDPFGDIGSLEKNKNALNGGGFQPIFTPPT